MTPASWLALLERLLALQQLNIELPERYYAGDHRLTFVTRKFRSAFGSLFQALADNWCRTVVDAPVERMRIEGFRFGENTDADKEAWELWQANNLDAASVMLHTEAVKDGCAFILVAPPTNGDYAKITVEHPSQMVVVTEAGNRRNRLAALKRWRDEADYDWAVLYLPDQIVWWRSQGKASQSGGRPNWQRDDSKSGGNPAGVVPVFCVENNPTMLGGGQSDLAPVIPMQDVINKLWADLLIASEYTAHPQRYATGVEVPTDDTGQPLADFEIKTAMTRLLVSEEEGARFGQLDGADLKAYIDPIREALNHLAAQSRTPPHYLLGSIINSSGDALKAAETGLTARVRRKIIDFSEPWEDAMRLAFRLQGQNEQADALGAETIWADPEYRSQGELVDSLTKLSTLGVPNEILWERAGFTPQEIERMRGQQDADAFLAQALAPPPMPMNGNAGTPAVA